MHVSLDEEKSSIPLLGDDRLCEKLNLQVVRPWFMVPGRPHCLALRLPGWWKVTGDDSQRVGN